MGHSSAFGGLAFIVLAIIQDAEQHHNRHAHPRCQQWTESAKRESSLDPKASFEAKQTFLAMSGKILREEDGRPKQPQVRQETRWTRTETDDHTERWTRDRERDTREKLENMPS